MNVRREFYKRMLKTGESKKQAENDSIKSWNIYYEKLNNKRRKLQNNTLSQKKLKLI